MKGTSVFITGLISICTLLILFGFQSCISSKNSGARVNYKNLKNWKNPNWEKVKSDNHNHPSWTIYKRKVIGSNFLEYKIEGEIQSTPKACVTLFKEDVYEQAASLNNKKYPTYEIIKKSKDSILIYLIHKEPFPLRNTEMSVRYLFFNDGYGTAGVKWTEAWDDKSVPPPTKKLSRVEAFRGSWNFMEMNNNECKAENIVKFDPKKMPLWLVEPMVFKFLKDGFLKFKNKTLN